MFRNTAHLIKLLAKVQAGLGIAVSILGGILVLILSIVIGNFLYIIAGSFLALVIIALGSFASWSFNLLIYGFGELIENSAVIAKYSAEASLTEEKIKHHV